MSSVTYIGHLRWNAGGRAQGGEGADASTAGKGMAPGGPAHAQPRSVDRDRQDTWRESTPMDMKRRYLVERYRRGRPPAPEGPAGDPAPTAVPRRHEAVQFGVLGALCAVGSSAAMLSGPFPLNIAAGVGIAVPFAVEAVKKIRRRRGSAPPRA